MSAAAAATSAALDVPETISVSSASLPCLRARRDGRRDRFPGARLSEVARVQSQVELGDVEAEELDHPLEPGDSPLADAAPAVGREARADRAQVVEQVGRPAIVRRCRDATT